MSEAPRELRSLLITVTGGRCLLPNANVAEIITAATPDPVENAPSWLLGRVRWRGWRVPLFSFSLLTGLAEKERALNAKVCILKSLGSHQRMPYTAMLCLGFPRLTTVTPDILIPTGSEYDVTPGVRHRVLLRDDQAYIPDLTYIEGEIAGVLTQAAA